MRRCLKCKAYKLAAIGLIADQMGFPGFEFIPASREVEKRMKHILTNLERKNERKRS